MQVFVKTTTCQTQVALEVEPSETIESLKSKLREAWEIPVTYKLKLAYQGDRLDDIRFLSDYNIQNHSRIQLLTPGGTTKFHFLLYHDEIMTLMVKRGIGLPEIMEKIDIYQTEGVLEGWEFE